MQLSPRVARDPRVEAEETAEPGAKAPGDMRWFQRFGQLFGQKAVQPKGADPNANALLAFPSETIPRPEAPRIAEAIKRPTRGAAKPSPTTMRATAILGGIAVVVGLGAFAIQRYPLREMVSREPQPGNLTINTRPTNSEILIDGVRRGATPLTLVLAPGTP